MTTDPQRENYVGELLSGASGLRWKGLVISVNHKGNGQMKGTKETS